MQLTTYLDDLFLSHYLSMNLHSPVAGHPRITHIRLSLYWAVRTLTQEKVIQGLYHSQYLMFDT